MNGTEWGWPALDATVPPPGPDIKALGRMGPYQMRRAGEPSPYPGGPSSCRSRAIHTPISISGVLLCLSTVPHLEVRPAPAIPFPCHHRQTKQLRRSHTNRVPTYVHIATEDITRPCPRSTGAPSLFPPEPPSTPRPKRLCHLVIDDVPKWMEARTSEIVLPLSEI